MQSWHLFSVALLAAAAWMHKRGQAESTTGTGAAPTWGWLIGGTDPATDYQGSTPDMSQPRGIRNHNPGNIEYTGTQWQGLADPPSDGRYAIFKEPKWGIRAMARVLHTYATSHGLVTVGDIINRWAPVHDDNPTTAYVKYVADKLNVGPTQQIDVVSRRDELIAAMIQFENGQQPYSMATIREGVALS